MGFASRKNLYIRRIIFVILTVFSAVFAHSRGLIPQINGVSPMVLVPLVVSIAMFEKSFTGMIFGAFAGILWDMFSVTADGYFSIMLAVIGFFCGVIITHVFRNNIVSALILSFGSTVICTLGYWLIFIVANSYTDPMYILQRYYLTGILYTMIFVFIEYYIVMLVFKFTMPKRRKITY